MRKQLFEYSKIHNITLLHCDMFPFEADNVINLGLGESNAVNVAIGASRNGVCFIYGVCGFILHRYEQLKNASRLKNGLVVLFNAGGSNNPCYSKFGEGHTCFEDDDLIDSLIAPHYKPTHSNFNKVLDTILKNRKGLVVVSLSKDLQ